MNFAYLNIIHDWVRYMKRNDLIYRSGTVNSKSLVSKVLLQIKRKFELIYAM